VDNDYDYDHEAVRNNMTWGTYGKSGREVFKRVLLKDLSTCHIHAILENCSNVAVGWDIRDHFIVELCYRDE